MQQTRRLYMHDPLPLWTCQIMLAFNIFLESTVTATRVSCYQPGSWKELTETKTWIKHILACMPCERKMQQTRRLYMHDPLPLWTCQTCWFSTFSWSWLWQPPGTAATSWSLSWSSPQYQKSHSKLLCEWVPFASHCAHRSVNMRQWSPWWDPPLTHRAYRCFDSRSQNPKFLPPQCQRGVEQLLPRRTACLDPHRIPM